MLRYIWRALTGSPKLIRVPFTDSILGELRPDGFDWSSTISRGQDSFTISVPGDAAPDGAALAHARNIVSNYESFKAAVKDCLATESHAYPEDAKAEVARLEIDMVSLNSADNGMILFRGGDDFRCWRCDYVDGQPKGLSCDT